MTEGERADGEGGNAGAGEVAGEVPIVVAGDPDPIAAGLQSGERGAVPRRQSTGATVVVEAVAQGHHGAGLEARDQRSKPGKGLAGIVGRQHLPAAGEGRTLFEMEVGNGEQTLVRPPQRALAEGFENDAHYADERRRG